MSNTDETPQETFQRLQAEKQLLQAQNRLLLDQARASQSAAVAKALDQSPNNPKPRPISWRPSDGVVKWNLADTNPTYNAFFGKALASGEKTDLRYSYEAIYQALSYIYDCVEALREIKAVYQSAVRTNNGDAAIAAIVGTEVKLGLIINTLVGISDLLQERLDSIVLAVAQGQTKNPAWKLLAETLNAQQGVDYFGRL